MTITYTGRFGKLLFRWKASLWKCLWKELLIFLILFYAISFTYRFALTDNQQEAFERVVAHLDRVTKCSIPMAFLLGNYVVTIVKRWWAQFENVGWPDNFLMMVGSYLNAGDRETTTLRRNIARYSILTAVLAWRNLSSRVLKRFPTADHLTKSGFMTPEELNLYTSTNAPFGRWFLPITWIRNALTEQKEQGKLGCSQWSHLLTLLMAYRKTFIDMFIYEWVSIPLVYTQVATVATYGYFALCLVARQEIRPADEDSPDRMDMMIPFTTVIEFLLYMGWLKVGEDLMHPFGEEDDDFELNYIIDRHLYVAYMIVDDLHGQMPSQIKTADPFEGQEPWLPYTKASKKCENHNPLSVKTPTLPFDEWELESPPPRHRKGSVVSATAFTYNCQPILKVDQ